MLRRKHFKRFKLSTCCFKNTAVVFSADINMLTATQIPVWRNKLCEVHTDTLYCAILLTENLNWITKWIKIQHCLLVISAIV